MLFPLRKSWRIAAEKIYSYLSLKCVLVGQHSVHQ